MICSVLLLLLCVAGAAASETGDRVQVTAGRPGTAVNRSVQTGRFTIANGQIIAPDGSVFEGRGINISDSNMRYLENPETGAPFTTVFPNISIIRLACYSYQLPAFYDRFIDAMTALGIVVIIENHQNSDRTNSGGGAGVVFTGIELSRESNWYNALAAHFADNPYVWFGTNNEPSIRPSAAALSRWQLTTYQAIRGENGFPATNNTSVITVSVGWGSANGGFGASSGVIPSVYAGMTNVVWDFHQYAWMYRGRDASVSTATMASSMKRFFGELQELRSADGVMPVIVGEYGDSTDGNVLDVSGMNLVRAVHQAGVPTMAWHWSSDYGRYDHLNSHVTGGKLTAPYGEAVAAHIQAGHGPRRSPIAGRSYGEQKR
ncbi:MAG: cellulase family glycosylhydrolase [Acetobacteraceae bacterium]